MIKEKDILLTVIQFGVENLHTPFKWKDLKEWLVTKEITTEENKEVIDKIISNYQNEIFIPRGGLHYLKVSSYFHLLEYEELKDSKKASKEARFYSTWALGMSLIALIVSIVIGFSSVKMDKKQFEVIQKISHQLEKNN